MYRRRFDISRDLKFINKKIYFIVYNLIIFVGIL